MSTSDLAIDWDAQPLGVESDTAIAARLGVCVNTVCTARLRRGIPTARKAGAPIDGTTRYADDARCQYVVAAHPDGINNEQIGELLGISRERVRQIVDSALDSLRRRCAVAGITEDDVRELFARRAQG